MSKKLPPFTAVQVYRNINARKSGIAPSHSFPEQSGKDAERKCDHSLIPPDQAERVQGKDWNRQLSLCEEGARVLRLGYTTELMNCLVLTEGEVSQLAQADPRSC